MKLNVTVCGLCIALIVIVAVSLYIREEGFAVPAAPVTPNMGDTVTCTIDVKNGKGSGALYRYDNSQNVAMLHSYPNATIAASWDPNYVNPKVIADCSSFTLGPDMQANAGSNVVSVPNGPNVILNFPWSNGLSGANAASPANSANSANSAINGLMQQPVAPVQNAAPVNAVNPQVSLSETAYTAMSLQQKSDLLKDIQKAVRNELIANRTTTPLDSQQLNATHTECGSTSTMQGAEYNKMRPNGADKQNDSQYIKKDSIPCWGCSLDY